MMVLLPCGLHGTMVLMQHQDRKEAEVVMETAVVSQEELARLTGYSRLTISRALRGHEKVAPQTRAKIVRLAEQHRYRPNAAARAIRNSQTHQIGVLLCNSPSRPFDNPSSMEMLVGLNNRLAADGFVVVLVRIGDVVDTLHRDSRVFHEQSLDGMIVYGAMSDEVLVKIRDLIPTCLFVDTNVWEPTCCIQRDEFAAGQMAAQALVASGYRRLVWLGKPLEPNHLGNIHYSLLKRYEGAMSVIREAGVKLDLEYCSAHHGVDEPESWLDLLNQAKRIFSHRDVGLLAYNTSGASQWTHAGLELGLKVGHDFGISCCDSSYFTTLDWPGLSRALFDRFDMGIQAAEMMIRLLKHPEFQCVSRLVQPQWHSGKTIGRLDQTAQAGQ